MNESCTVRVNYLWSASHRSTADAPIDTCNVADGIRITRVRRSHFCLHCLRLSDTRASTVPCCHTVRNMCLMSGCAIHVRLRLSAIPRGLPDSFFAVSREYEMGDSSLTSMSSVHVVLVLGLHKIAYTQ